MRTVTRAEITLKNPGTPALFQPYHEVMSLPWDEAVVAVRDAERAIEAAATQSLEALLVDLGTHDLDVASVAIVGAPSETSRPSAALTFGLTPPKGCCFAESGRSRRKPSACRQRHFRKRASRPSPQPVSV